MLKKNNTTFSSNPTRMSKKAHKLAKEKFPTYDTSMIVNKKSNAPKIIIAVIIAAVIAAIVVAVVFFSSGCTKTLAEGETVKVVIDEGSNAGDIAEKMSSAGVVSNSVVFKLTASDMGASTSMKPGTYVFEGGKTTEEYIEQLVAGPDSTSPRLVVSEGMRLSNIAKAVDSATDGRISAADFTSAASNASVYADEYSFLKEVGSNTLEGYLFPKTYAVKNDASAKDVVKMMLDQFKEETKNLDFSYPASKGLSMWEAVTLASIVQKESAQGVDAKVASVFYNRLDSGMYLNSDATTAYEVGHNPSAEEVHANTPYSTYTNHGLPPTPICSPGLEALQAVCNPEQTNYLYFYFKKDDQGQMQYYFSETYEQHQEVIARLSNSSN